MVMESSRGLFEKSRELGMKKPRLEEGSTNEMSNADVRELVIQYKIALAELTFNSKPIITNLTIIAGENLQAAKAIAATICSNIIEVPTDQKLPSLYLLDSIVKNIGRDYIKCFAARLPEVFCKAYRQVDPAVHSGMRHLFETWKGVFPLQCLQMIEKELGFPPSMNGSALRPTTYKPDLQPQRPAHSIHVNPKYVEARQRLQKPSRNMQQPIGNAITDPVQGKNTAHSEYQNGTELSRQPGSGILKTSDGALHQGYESPWYGAGSGDTEARSGQRNNCNTKAMLLSSSSPRPANDDAKSHPIHSIISSRNSSGMESWHSFKEEYMLDDLNSRSNIHNATRKSKRDPLLTDDSERLDFHTSLQSQNLHEFESMFDREASDDSLPLEQTEQEAFGSCSTSIWPRESHAVDGMSYYSSGRMMSGHSEDHYTSTSGLSANANALVRKPLPSPTIIGYSTNEMPRSSGSVRSRQCTRPMASLSGQSSMHQRPPSPSLSIPHYGNQGHNISEQELSRAQTLPHMDIRRSQVPEQLNLGLHRQFAFNPGTPIQNVHPGNSHKLQSHNLQALSSVKPSFKQGHHIPLMQQCQPVHGAYDTSAASIMEKTSPDCFDTPFSENPRQLSTPSLLAPVTESKIHGTSSHSGSTRLSFQAPDELPSHSSVQPPLPSSGPPPIQSEAKIASEFHVNSSYKITSLSSILPQAQAEQPPLPSGPPPASLVCGTSEQSKTTIKATPDPVSSLLSTLVAKGLISAPKTGLSASGPPQIISKPHNSLSQGTAVAPLVTTSYLKVSSTVPPLSSSEELSRSVFVHPLTTSFHRVSSAVVSSCSSEVLSLSDLDTKSCIIVPVTSLEEKKDLIGLEFKPNVIRELHPLVISDLLDNLSYHCSICDMRMKIIEQFDRHMEWHAAKNLKSESSNKTARGWYVSSNKWIAKKVSKHETEDISDVPGIAFGNNNEQMVPADENQCACVLCGELFEDIYNTKEDQWMFKGVVYLNLSSNDDVENTGDVASHGPIIHVDCISESSTHDLGLASL